MKECDFLRWFLEFQKRFTSVTFSPESGQWWAVIRNEEGYPTYGETFTDEQLYEKFIKEENL